MFSGTHTYVHTAPHSYCPPPLPLLLFRVICLCAQFEAVLQHGLRKSRGLALTAAALKQAAGFSSRNEGGTNAALKVKYQYVK